MPIILLWGKAPLLVTTEHGAPLLQNAWVSESIFHFLFFFSCFLNLAPCTSMLPTANSLNVTMGLHNSTATVTCLPSYQLLNVSANKTHFRCNNGTWTSISGVPTCDLIKVENGSTVAGQSDPMTKCEALAAAVLQSFGSATVISATWFSLGLFLVMR